MAYRILNRSAAVRAVPLTQFGSWDGTKTSAQLVDAYGRPLSSASVSAIYRNDWEGNQLLYPTARTNIAPYGDVATGWGGVGIAATPTTNATAGPDGGSVVVMSDTAATGYAQLNGHATSSAINAGQTLTTLLDIKLLAAADGIRNRVEGYHSAGGDVFGTNDFQIDIATGAVLSTQNCTCAALGSVGNGYYRFIVTSIPATANTPGGGLVLGPNLLNSYTGTGEPIFELHIMQSLDVTAATIGAYFPNSTGASLTLTDYTLSGATVNLAQAPAATATTTWDGQGLIDLGQFIPFTSSTAASSAPVGNQTYRVRLVATADCMVSIGGVANTSPSDLYVPAYRRPIYVRVMPGQIVSVKGISGSGNLSIAECEP